MNVGITVVILLPEYRFDTPEDIKTAKANSSRKKVLTSPAVLGRVQHAFMLTALLLLIVQK